MWSVRNEDDEEYEEERRSLNGEIKTKFLISKFAGMICFKFGM